MCSANDGEGTPDWSLNLPENEFMIDHQQMECDKERAQSMGYFKPKSSILAEKTRVSEIIAEPPNVEILHQESGDKIKDKTPTNFACQF